MTITVRIDAGPAGDSDLVETLRMAVGLALGEATVQVVFTDNGRRWWAATRDRDAALGRRLDDLRESLEAVGGSVAGLGGEGDAGRRRAITHMATSDLLINSVGPPAL